jgi:hypothetical protein
MRRLVVFLLSLSVMLPFAVQAQDANMLFPVPLIEERLLAPDLTVHDVRGSRMPQDRTQTVVLSFADSSTMRIKWAKAAPGGEAFNNEPRYEAAAYEIQKLFLDPTDYVVPPTLLRAVPVSWFRQYDEHANPTFNNTTSVVLVVQYWLSRVTPTDWWDNKRFDSDTVYARHLADFNVLTYLTRHSDENKGNYLISEEATSPRVFSVDNGVAFRSEASDRGYAWRELRVKRLPRATVERLRQITREDLDRALGIVAHFDVVGTELVRGEPTANLRDSRGVRRTPEAIQFGLTRAEINDVESRLRRLLQRVDEGKIEVF